MRKKFLRLGALLVALAVALGAFGAHGLKDMVEPGQIAIYETGVRYHFYHAFAILVLGVLLYFRKTSMMLTAGWLFLAGIVLFSGSLYLLSVKDIFNLPAEILGPLTPIGGVLFIIGWVVFIASTYQTNLLYKKGSK
jgi:uncharacterized membrane protein YgdD (TMEM256/DUF423 family)